MDLAHVDSGVASMIRRNAVHPEAAPGFSAGGARGGQRGFRGNLYEDFMLTGGQPQKWGAEAPLPPWLRLWVQHRLFLQYLLMPLELGIEMYTL